MVRVIFFLIFLCLALPGLSQPEGEQAPDNPPQEEEIAPIERISKIQQFLKPFEYDRDQLRDPFEVQAKGGPLEPGRVYGPFLPTQVFRLSEFKLKGLLWRTQQPVALFRDPKGREHRLSIKDYIGENFGYIATIRENEVVVIQTIEEDNRRYSTTKVVFLDKK